MTVQPPTPPGLLTLDDWMALPEDEVGRTELQEGVLIVSPRPQKPHQRTAVKLAVALHAQLPDHLEVLPEIDAAYPPTVRIPDLVVCRTDAPAKLSAADVVLAIEIVSPGSAGLDNVMKRHEYARAGIEHYWIVNPDRSLTTLRRTADGDYAETAAPTDGHFRTDTPFRIDLDLTSL